LCDGAEAQELRRASGQIASFVEQAQYWADMVTGRRTGRSTLDQETPTTSRWSLRTGTETLNRSRNSCWRRSSGCSVCGSALTSPAGSMTVLLVPHCRSPLPIATALPWGREGRGHSYYWSSPRDL